MPAAEPIVTKVIDADGVERWGAAGAEWVTKGLADGSLTDPEATASVSVAPVKPAEEAKDAPPVPADGDGPDSKARKR